MTDDYRSEYPSEVLEAGTRAPDFELRATPDQSVRRDDFRGWSPVCNDQMALYNELLPELRRQGAELVGIPVSTPAPTGVLVALDELTAATPA